MAYGVAGNPVFAGFFRPAERALPALFGFRSVPCISQFPRRFLPNEHADGDPSLGSDPSSICYDCSRPTACPTQTAGRTLCASVDRERPQPARRNDLPIGHGSWEFWGTGELASAAVATSQASKQGTASHWNFAASMPNTKECSVSWPTGYSDFACYALNNNISLPLKSSKFNSMRCT
jgi:hypothetical protein